ncbi:MAG TPA: ribonuclease HIII [Planctomycetota bacterium]|nr:ribonuclease HIII [Planctomycetota bacterium]
MAQRTLVLKLPTARGPGLRSALAAAGFEFRGVPHSVFSARGPDLVATLYRSGKLVLQGADPEGFAARFLDGAPGRPPEPASATPALTVTTVGTDESGKGDYFGPLVVAGVRLTPELAAALAGGEVRDCKLLGDAAVMRLGAALRARVPFAIRRLDPPDYNAAHARLKNLNPVLAGLHAEVIHELAEPGVRVVVDQFADPRLVVTALGALDVDLVQKTRAESSELSVAAASILARQEFLAALKDLSETWGVDLAKGAGAPTDSAGRRFVAAHGTGQLGQVAKLHFKNTLKIGAEAAR